MTSIMYKFRIYILQYKRIKGGEYVGDGFMKWTKEEKNKKFVIALVLAVVLVIGLTFLPLNNKQSQPITTTIKQVATSNEEDYSTALEKRLTNMLSKMEGAGTVSVMVTIESNEEKILAEDRSCNSQRTEEKDQAGGTRVTDSMQQTNDVVLQNGKIKLLML